MADTIRMRLDYSYSKFVVLSVLERRRIQIVVGSGISASTYWPLNAHQISTNPVAPPWTNQNKLKGTAGLIIDKHGYEMLDNLFNNMPEFVRSQLADLVNRGVIVVENLTTAPITAEDITDTAPNGVIVIWKTSGVGGGEGEINYPSVLPLAPGTVTINWTSGASGQSQTDDGAGGFTGDGNPSGSTISYQDGEIVLDTTGLPPDNATTITIDFTNSLGPDAILAP